MRRWMPFLLLLAGVALAGDDPRGWTEGTTARNALRVLGPMPTEVTLDLPDTIVVSGPTLLVYFGPTCPHCQDVAPELAALATRTKGRLAVIGVATGRSTPEELDAFKLAYGWEFTVVRDENGKIGDAMRVNSTPSAVLVRPDKRRAVVVDLWYPYQRGSDTLVEMRVAENPWSAFRPGEYQGNLACAVCHIDEADAWALTHHAVAWNTLEKGGKSADPACVSCHVTGAGQPTGYAGEPGSMLVDVGCEACHGPGGPHDGARTDALSTCSACHDDKHSIGFTVARAVPLLDHFRTTGWDDERWRTERATLIAGEAKRTMVGFAEGETVGAVACATCHTEPHGAWAAGKHAHAMDVLSETERTDVACVRCHATSVTPGPAATSLAGYRVDEGVGCESCHGPGKAHADSGGTAPIESLGEDCPVCVVEALCTSCHTPAQDPDWELERDLPLAGHRVVSP